MEAPIAITLKEESSKNFELISTDDKYGLKIGGNSVENKIKLSLTPIKDKYLVYNNEYSMEELINLNSNFKNYNSINELINTFEALIKNKKIFIENNQNDPTDINLGILFYNFLGKETKFLLNLKLNINKEDYNKYLLITISNLKKIITQKDEEIKNIKSEFNGKINSLEQRIKEIENIIKNEKKTENNENNNNNLQILDNFTHLIESDILNDKSNFELLYNRLKQIKQNIKFNLIFKADKNNSSVYNFHKNCDEKKNVLVLIRTDKDVRFGGFTSEGFDSKSGYKKDNKAFIFSLNKKKIYEIKKGKNAICNSSNYGPCFIGAKNGSGYYNISIKNDIFRDQQHTGDNKNNSYEITYDFELNNGEKDFKIKQLEVFQIS